MADHGVYGRLSDLKARVMGVKTTALDAVLLSYLEDASRRIDNVCRRHFYAKAAQTRYYDGRGCRELWLEDDLLAVTALAVDEDADGTWGLSLTEGTDYWLWPDNPLPHEPYNRIDLIPYGTQLGRWPRGRRRVQIVGKFGYSDETEAVRTAAGVAVELASAISSTTATSATLDAEHGVDPGEVLLIESEQVYVEAVDVNTLTLERGVNGTTAATHVANTAVYRRRYPRRVEEVCVELAVQSQWSSQSGLAAVMSDQGATVYSQPVTDRAIRIRLGAYLNPTGMVA